MSLRDHRPSRTIPKVCLVCHLSFIIHHCQHQELIGGTGTRQATSYRDALHSHLLLCQIEKDVAAYDEVSFVALLSLDF
jgi:hypothetical protein